MLENDTSTNGSGIKVEVGVKKGFKVDGIYKFERELPFKTTTFEEFQQALQNLLMKKKELNSKSLKSLFSENQNWNIAFDGLTDIDFGKFLESSVFVSSNGSSPRMSKERL